MSLTGLVSSLTIYSTFDVDVIVAADRTTPCGEIYAMWCLCGVVIVIFTLHYSACLPCRLTSAVESERVLGDAEEQHRSLAQGVLVQAAICLQGWHLLRRVYAQLCCWKDSSRWASNSVQTHSGTQPPHASFLPPILRYATTVPALEVQASSPSE